MHSVPEKPRKTYTKETKDAIWKAFSANIRANKVPSKLECLNSDS
jgi:hypothetical protein